MFYFTQTLSITSYQTHMQARILNTSIAINNYMSYRLNIQYVVVTTKSGMRVVCQHGITPSFIFRRFAVRCALTISSWLRNHKERPTVFHGMNLRYRTLDARIIATYVCVKNVQNTCMCKRCMSLSEETTKLEFATCKYKCEKKNIKFFINIIVDNSCLLLNTHTRLWTSQPLILSEFFFLNILKNLF